MHNGDLSPMSRPVVGTDTGSVLVGCAPFPCEGGYPRERHDALRAMCNDRGYPEAFCGCIDKGIQGR